MPVPTQTLWNIRRLNIVFGVLYTVIILITMWQWAFYVLFGIIEVALTGLVVWYAWNWPRQEAATVIGRRTDERG